MTTAHPEIRRDARLSEDGRYRYTLTRSWGGGALRETDAVVWVCLNPSTADHERDDPTIRRMIGFTRSWNYTALVVVNLFALRARDPRELARTQAAGLDPIGPDNDTTLLSVCEGAPLVVAGWGAHEFARPRAAQVLRMIDTPELGLQPVACLGRTKDGHPRHPLYSKWDAQLSVLRQEEWF